MERRMALNNADKKVIHILKLIEGVNADLKIGFQRGDDLMIRQYQHLKEEYTHELNVLLGKYELKVTAKEPA